MTIIKKENYEPIFVNFFKQNPELLKVPAICTKLNIIPPLKFWYANNTFFIAWPQQKIRAMYSPEKNKFYFQTPYGNNLTVKYVMFRLKKKRRKVN